MSRQFFPNLLAMFLLVFAFVPANHVFAGELCIPFYDSVEFENFMLDQGKFLKGIEDFEESNIPDGELAFIPAPLDFEPNVDPTTGWGFPDGLEQTNIQIWDNIWPDPWPPELHPSGDPRAIFVVGLGASDANSKKIGVNQDIGAMSMDLVFTEPNHTGIGFELAYLDLPGDGWHISVYNKFGAEIGKFEILFGEHEPFKNFFGIWCSETIGRINIYNYHVLGVPFTIDDIQMWREFPDYPHTVEIPPGQDPAEPDDGVITVPCDTLIRYDDLEDDWPLVGYSVGGPVGQEPQLLSIIGTTPADADSYLIQSAGFWAEFWVLPGLVPVFVRSEADTTVQTVEMIMVTGGGKWEVNFSNPICIPGNTDFSVVLCVAEGVWGVTGEDTDGIDNRSYWSKGDDCAPRNPLFSVDLMIWACVTPCGPPPLCMPFFEQQEFEDFMLQSGKLQKGVETFEESNVPPGEITAIPAPLDQFPNVNPDDGWGFPDGLEQTNIVIWDNISPEPNPPELNPSGDPFAIAVFGENILGANSEKIAINFFATPSMDLVFTEPNHTGIGFNLSYMQGFVGDGWHISVFNKMGDEIGKFQVPSPGSMEPSKSFFGIWCEETIGRINIFDKSGTGDAIDNIQMWREIPPTCLAFYNQGEFEDYMNETDKFLHGVETFEESNIPDEAVVAIPAPLDKHPNVDPGTGWGFPEGLEQTDIIIWDNISPEPNPPDLNPSGDPAALAVLGQNFAGVNSKKVGNNYFATPSMDIVFSPSLYTGIAFELAYATGMPGEGWHVSVFSKDGEEIGKFQLLPEGEEPFKTFFGIWCEEWIGRINIFDKSLTGDIIDNIQMWKSVTSVDGESGFDPNRVVLYQNAPNPFNPRTMLRFSIPRTSKVKLLILDVLGRRVKTLVNGELEPGLHKVMWDGTDQDGHPVTSGVFLSRLTTGDYTTSRKMILLK